MDPRIAMGLTVEEKIVGPYFLRPAERASPDEGGSLDRAIIAHTVDGREMAIGELWAVGSEIGSRNRDIKIRLDTEAIGEHIIELLEAHDKGPESEGDG